jgi:hypothetical protein
LRREGGLLWIYTFPEIFIYTSSKTFQPTWKKVSLFSFTKLVLKDTFENEEIKIYINTIAYF